MHNNMVEYWGKIELSSSPEEEIARAQSLKHTFLLKCESCSQ